ncbi:MAG TPA: hypothetical protein VFE33_16785 [Thermoanaerobaculia bacterium]|nr:hypothetical protein [Thermoanaerobaculia bacterium]
MVLSDIIEEGLFPTVSLNDFGFISIRVVVLPRKEEAEDRVDEEEILDMAEGETLLEEGPTPVASYLERPKGGKLCCVFLVNGQRQEGLDNSFIVQQLGFKYLRKRMMIIVDVDGLRPEALGELMQGSRQGFYKGRTWEAIFSRLIATLKGDPDLQKLEEDAEAEVAELQAGDQKVKEALDTLIESHHQYADHVVVGAGNEPGLQDADSVLGASKPVPDSLVALLSPDRGEPSDYPVLVSNPASSALRLKPDVERKLVISSTPANSWPALASFAYELGAKIPELHIAEERSERAVEFRLRFDPPDGFDEDDYPVRTTFRAFARFNGYREPRQLSIELIMQPVVAPAETKLLENPTYIRISTRQPVRLWLGGLDTHVRVRWDGNDDLALGPSPRWTFNARCLTPGRQGLLTTFSQPSRGRLSLLVVLPPDALAGEQLSFEVVAAGPQGKILSTQFDAVITERPVRPQPEPRLVSGTMPAGASRRPPYDLKYIERPSWQNGTCFGGENWSPEDAGAYQEPTDKRPLTLLINQDMASLDVFRKYLMQKKLTETEVQSRLQKYTSHVAFHLYQMYQSAQSIVGRSSDDDSLRPATPQEQRAEIHRVATTLLKLMQVSR